MALNLGTIQHILDVAFVADGAIFQGAVVTLSSPSSDNNARVTVAASSSVTPLGVALVDAADGEVVRVQMLGLAYVVASGPFSAGDNLAIAAASGKVDTASSTDQLVGVALEAATALNDLVVCKLYCNGSVEP
jgi:phosphoribosylformylglycinamidine (FGAM) synthase-like amidotransferase family enzyme